MDFVVELKRFKPSPDVDSAEEDILRENKTVDAVDIVEETIKAYEDGRKEHGV